MKRSGCQNQEHLYSGDGSPLRRGGGGGGGSGRDRFVRRGGRRLLLLLYGQLHQFLGTKRRVRKRVPTLLGHLQLYLKACTFTLIAPMFIPLHPPRCLVKISDIISFQITANVQIMDVQIFYNRVYSLSRDKQKVLFRSFSHFQFSMGLSH